MINHEKPIRVGLVLPLYNEEAALPLFHAALTEAIAGRDEEYFLIYVNDGSKDNTKTIATRLAQEMPNVVLLNLAKNSGHQMAVTAGLDYCHEAGYDAVGIMDTDLQDPPAVLLEMIDVWKAGEAQVVYGQRRARSDSFMKKHTALLFYKTLSKMSEVDIPQNVADFRVLDKKVVAEVVKHREHDRFLRGIISSVGFNQQAVLFDRPERVAGETHYPLKKMIELASAGIFGFSTLPLKMITRIGVFVSTLSFIVSVVFLVLKLVSPESSVPGWSFLAVGMFFFSGVQLVFLGIIGEYLKRIYLEVLNRPLYSLASKVENGIEE